MRELKPDQSLAIADFALRRGCTRDELHFINSQLSMEKFRGQTQRIINLADPGAESPPESFVRSLVIAAGFESEVSTQLPVFTRLGTYYLDVALEALKIALEYDGELKYAEQNTHILEKKREDAIREQGWIFIRVTKEDLHNRRSLITRLQQLAAGRGWQGPLPSATWHTGLRHN